MLALVLRRIGSDVLTVVPEIGIQRFSIAVIDADRELRFQVAIGVDLFTVDKAIPQHIGEAAIEAE